MFRQVSRWLSRTLRTFSQGGARRLLRFLFGASARRRRQQRFAAAGFVLPTAALLTIVIFLFVGAILVQTFSRTAEVASEQQGARVDNIAQPAVDRAKAKLEFLFRDPRFPNGIPAERFLLAMLNNTDANNDGLVDIDIGGGTQISFEPDPITGGDIYTLPGETRVNIDNDPALDNAWTFTSDLDGDGNVENIAYSITLLNQNDDPTGNTITTTDEDDLQVKAANSVTRTGPISVRGFGDTNVALASCPLEALSPARGWTPIGTGRFRKNLQVNIFVESGNPNTRSVSAFEFQQDRDITQGNAFGVWFRYDLLIHPGPQFNLNGAIHTDGNLVTYNDSLRFFLVSAPNSCIYNNEANVITLAETSGINPATGALEPLFQGQLITLNDGSPGEDVDLFPPNGGAPGASGLAALALNEDSDSILETIGPNSVNDNTAAYLLDPIQLFTRNELRSRGHQLGNMLEPLDALPNDPLEAGYDPNVRDPDFGRPAEADIGDRVFNDNEIRPFVDDTYRADNRFGPQPTYGRNGQIAIPDATFNGTPISDLEGVPPGSLPDGFTAANVEELLRLDSPNGEPETIGLDGYWERRSHEQGARLIVGQRLELGNHFGWRFDSNGDGDFVDNPIAARTTSVDMPLLDRDYGNDPLNPPEDDDLTLPGNQAFVPPAGDGMDSRPNEYRQQRTLRDNLAAVQAGVFYHTSYDADGDGIGDRDFPAACLALTAHPGTLVTKTNSTTFTTDVDGVNVDFLSGTGTNGWEFSPPANQDNATDFATSIGDGDNPLRVALTNLANFAGDPQGAFPPTQETLGPNAMVHPYPQLTMWGDFSNLRRLVGDANDGVDFTAADFADLSIADQTTIHTASCLLGMLAYSLDQKEQILDPASAIGADIQTFSVALRNLFNGNCSSGLLFDPALYGDPACANSVFSATDFPPGDNSAWNDPEPNTVISDPGNPNNNICPPGTDGPGFTPECDEAELLQTFIDEPDPTLGLSQRLLNVLTSPAVNANVPASLDTPAEIDALADRVTDVVQVRRDRELGFAEGGRIEDSNNPSLELLWNQNQNVFFTNPNDPGQTGTNLIAGRPNIALPSNCDPDLFEPVQSTSGTVVRARAGLAILLCRRTTVAGAPPQPQQPFYPSLYYIFPTASHQHDGTVSTAVQTAGGNETLQPGQTFIAGNVGCPIPQDPANPCEPYVADPNVNNINNNPPNAVTYRVVGDGDGNGVEDAGEAGIGAIALLPRTPGINCTTGAGGWCLPYRNTSFSPDNPGDLSPSTFNQITVNGVNFFPAFLDVGMMNGRQLMAVRVLNVDLDILRDNFSANAPNNPSVLGGESWLPSSGLIYAFREDAFREDGIARPNAVPFDSCDTEPELLTSINCRMNPAAKVDPPASDLTGVSLKPVDYVADPDRRPHGFRLANGLELGRTGTVRGLSFISDNPVYFLGNFNDHTFEEFENDLNIDNFNNFYDRGDLETRFARATANDAVDANTDRWRPSEVLSDAITFLSVDYCDGTIEAGLRQNDQNAVDGETCDDNSFRNTNIRGRAETDSIFVLEDSTLSPTSNTVPSAVPIAVDRNGVFRYDQIGGSIDLLDYGSRNDGNGGRGDYNNSNQNRPLNAADDTRVSAAVISGLSPTRVDETYGGLHNFPRFNETWGGDNLVIRGSLIQLNFSVYDTANLDQQDTFDFNNQLNGSGGSDFSFYSPPRRRWGYDPALQYVAASPAVARLLSSGRPRSEIFDRIDATDPYIQQLCQAITPRPDACPT